MSNYLFAVAENADGKVFASIVKESFFRKYGYLDDQHLSRSCGGQLPDILGWDEEMESSFVPWKPTMFLCDAHDDLVSKGFTFDSALADFLERTVAREGTVYRPGS